MEPTRDVHGTVVDLLDRVLDKGLVINADIVISVAGVPLLGINLRAALAGMETMLKYGLMRDLDERIRRCAQEDFRKRTHREEDKEKPQVQLEESGDPTIIYPRNRAGLSDSFEDQIQETTLFRLDSPLRDRLY